MASPLHRREPVDVNPSLAELGARLREAREAKGVSLEVLSSQTRIHVRHLRALEEAREDLLPEPFYVKSFVRKVGDALGLDGSGMAGTYWDQRPPQAVTAPLETPLVEVVMPWWIWPLMASAVLAAIVGTMAVTRPDGVPTLLGGTQGDPLVATASASPVANEDAVPGATASDPLAAAASDGQVIASGEATVDAAVTAATEAALASGSSADAAAAPGLAPSPTPLSPARPLRFGVRTVAASWMRIAVDGKVVHEGMVPGGSDRQWGAERQLAVRIGQPGQVEGRLNDASLGRLGQPGASVYAMSFRLTPQGIARTSLLQPAQARPPQRVLPAPAARVQVRPARPASPIPAPPSTPAPAEADEAPVDAQSGATPPVAEESP